MPRYPQVNHSHIVPTGYLGQWADNGMLMMRLVGRADSQRISVRDAAVRKSFYKRTRRDGSRIDDIEWSLGHLENAAIPLLPKIRDLWPLKPDAKQRIAQFVGYQLVRSPRWREWYESITKTFVDANMRARQMPVRLDEKPATDEEVQEFEHFLLGDTRRSVRMLSAGPKVASMLASMHWTLLESRSPLIATSDHPVAPWPLQAASRRPEPYSFVEHQLLDTLEVRIPVSPRLAVLMTWLDDADETTPVSCGREVAANLNAFTIAEAEMQWFHSGQSAPPWASGKLLPLSPMVIRGYSAATVAVSRRRAVIQQKIRARIADGGDLGDNDIDMVVVSRSSAASR